MVNQIGEISLKVLNQELPGVSDRDISNLIINLEHISDTNRNVLNSIPNSQQSLERWLPGPKTVKEILNTQISLNDLKLCIDDFINFAGRKGWGIEDNLDPKLITHIKIMIQQSKIKQAPVNPDDFV